MDKLSSVERLQEIIDFAHDNEADSIAVSLDELEAWQRVMKMFCWGVDMGDTVVISRKRGISIAMAVKVGKQPDAGIERTYGNSILAFGGAYGNSILVAEAVSDALTDLALGVKALIEEVERLADA